MKYNINIKTLDAKSEYEHLINSLGDDISRHHSNLERVHLRVTVSLVVIIVQLKQKN